MIAGARLCGVEFSCLKTREHVGPHLDVSDDVPLDAAPDPCGAVCLCLIETTLIPEGQEGAGSRTHEGVHAADRSIAQDYQVELLTTADTARLMGVQPRRIVELCATGRIRDARKVGRDWIIPSRGGRVAIEPAPTQTGPRIIGPPYVRPLVGQVVETRSAEFQPPPEAPAPV